MPQTGKASREMAHQSTTQPRVLYVDVTQTDHHSYIMHRHSDLMEVLMCRSGHGIYCVEGSRFQFREGDIVICDCGTVHDEIPYDDQPFTTVCVALTSLQVEGLPPNCILPGHVSPMFYKPRQFGELCQLAELMGAHYRGGSTCDEYLCRQLAGCFTALLGEMIDEQLAEHRPIGALVEKAKHYIDIHYAENITLESLSQDLNVSTSYLSHLFKNQSGYSFKQYIIRRRIGEAQTLLENTSMKITDIATRTGFGDSSHFNKIFTKHVGMRPKDYRRFRKSVFHKPVQLAP